MSTDKPWVVCSSWIMSVPVSGARKIYARLQDHFNIVPIDEVQETSAMILQRVQGLVTTGNVPLPNQILEELPNLRCIVMHGKGYDQVDLEYLKSRGISLGLNANENGARSVAEFALCLMLQLSRHLSMRGIIGMGAIGLYLAKLLKAFNTTILYTSRKRKETLEVELGLKYCANLHELLSQVDYVILACPLTGETRHLIGREEFKVMKSSAYLINIARGGIVDTHALIDALKTHKIAGAGLDVTDPEPLPSDHPLMNMQNVIVTPHCAWATEEGMAQSVENIIKSLKDGIAGRALQLQVL